MKAIGSWPSGKKTNKQSYEASSWRSHFQNATWNWEEVTTLLRHSTLILPPDATSHAMQGIILYNKEWSYPKWQSIRSSVVNTKWALYKCLPSARVVLVGLRCPYLRHGQSMDISLDFSHPPQAWISSDLCSYSWDWVAIFRMVRVPPTPSSITVAIMDGYWLQTGALSGLGLCWVKRNWAWQLPLGREKLAGSCFQFSPSAWWPRTLVALTLGWNVRPWPTLSCNLR